jgi:hypothetical protein
MNKRILKDAVGSVRYSLDNLERRVMLSANVSATVVGGILTIVGGAAANAIVMDQTGLTATRVRISGTSGTTINGQPGPLVLSGVSGLRVGLGGGDDSITFNGIKLSKGLSIGGGAGNNTIILKNATVGTTLSISNGSDGGTTNLSGAIVAGNLLFSGGGNENIIARKLKIGGTTKLTTLQGADTIRMDDSALHALSINTGAGDDLVQIDANGGATGPATVFSAAVAIALGDGVDTLQVGVKGQAGNHATFRSTAHFNGGAQHDTLFYSDVASLANGSVIAFESINPIPGASGVNLRSASTFAILSGAGISNTGPTIIHGDLGTSPTGTVTGAPTVNGQIHRADPIAALAKLDLTTAYNDAKGRAGTPTIALPGELSGLTLAPGIYKNASSVKLSSGNLTLDAQGHPNAVFIFQMGTTLTTISNTHIILAGGALAANIYWQVGSSATLGTDSTFKGNILADQSITLTSRAALEGRALARIGAVVLDSNTVDVPVA